MSEWETATDESRKRRVKTPSEVVGPAKVDRRTKDMIRRLVAYDKYAPRRLATVSNA